MKLSGQPRPDLTPWLVLLLVIYMLPSHGAQWWSHHLYRLPNLLHEDVIIDFFRQLEGLIKVGNT